MMSDVHATLCAWEMGIVNSLSQTAEEKYFVKKITVSEFSPITLQINISSSTSYFYRQINSNNNTH